jgi:hypothetical protein
MVRILSADTFWLEPCPLSRGVFLEMDQIEVPVYEPRAAVLPLKFGPNDGGIKRGDREVTGDEEARPTEGVDRGGSGVRGTGDGTSGQPTADPSAMPTKPTSRGTPGVDPELDIRDENDPSLGITSKEDYW